MLMRMMRMMMLMRMMILCDSFSNETSEEVEEAHVPAKVLLQQYLS